MFSKSLGFILPAAVVAVMAFGAPAHADLSKEDVNQLIHDYILKNPQLILDSVNDFQKRSSIIHCSAAGASDLGKTASVLARGESLTAHARSAEYRIKN